MMEQMQSLMSTISDLQTQVNNNNNQTTKQVDTTTEDEETVDADVDEMVDNVHDSTAGHTATASTAAPNASPRRKATSTARPMRIGSAAATPTVTLAADGGGQH